MITTSATDSLYPAPEDAVTYQLVPSVTMLKTNATRTISTSCTVTAYKVVGGARTEYNGLIAVVGYDENGTMRYSSTGNGSVTFSTNTTSSSGVLCVRFECAVGVTGTGIVARCTVPVVMDGAKGDSVVNALPVPAGEYDATVTYTNNGVLTPYVLDGSLYYVLTKVGSVTGVRPSVDVADQGGNWTLIENYSPIFTEILMANLALLGKAVFHGNYMFSQYGKRGSSVINTPGNYSAPTEAGGNFDPNILIDFMTGFFRCVNAEITGKVNAEEGRIAGFLIEGNSLENDNTSEDAQIVIENTTRGTKAAMAGNLLPGSASGVSAVAQFANHDATNDVRFSTNFALLVSARNAGSNVAIRMDGGSFSCMAMRNKVLETGASSQALSRYDYNVITLNSSSITLTLPRMELYDDGHVIRIKRLGSGSVKIVAQNCYTYNGTTPRLGLPCFNLNRDEQVDGNTGFNLSSAADAVELVWVRDLDYTISGTTYHGCWVEYKLPRDW